MPRRNLVGVIYLKAALCSFCSRVRHNVVRWQSGDRNKMRVEEDVNAVEAREAPPSPRHALHPSQTTHLVLGVSVCFSESFFREAHTICFENGAI